MASGSYGDEAKPRLSIFVLINLICLVSLVVLGLHCCAGLSLVAESRGYSLAGVHRLLIAVAPLLAECRL